LSNLAAIFVIPFIVLAPKTNILYSGKYSII
jgi:hypothetical protein